MTFKRPPRRPPKQYEGANPAAPRPVVASRGQLAAMLEAGAVAAAPPAARRRVVDPIETLGAKIRESARGEPCTVRLPGVCLFEPQYSIWSHARWGAQLGDAGRGMATKALDVCGAYACTACDAAYDGQARAPHLTRDEIDLAWCMGHLRSLGRLVQKGIL
jgi:hypothetical protein